MILDLAKFERTPLETDPFDYLVVEEFIAHEALTAAIADFPKTPGLGLYPPAVLRIAGGFRTVVDELTGEVFREAVERKFGLSLMGRPLMYTVRGHTDLRDGGIHNDSATKLITVLVYFNEAPWPHAGGRLRLLRSRHDIADYATEVAPCGGALIAFRRSGKSWHGHLPFVGPRKAVQVNWVTDRGVAARETARHGASALLQRALPKIRA
jgi:SM-20-related protein